MFALVRSNSVNCGLRISLWHRAVQLDFACPHAACVETFSWFLAASPYLHKFLLDCVV